MRTSSQKRGARSDGQVYRRRIVAVLRLGTSSPTVAGIKADPWRIRNILLDIENGIGRVTINRPHVLNALNRRRARTARAFEQCRDDEAVRVVVLSGAGRAFSAGGDIKEMAMAGEALPESFFEELLGRSTGRDDAPRLPKPSSGRQRDGRGARFQPHAPPPTFRIAARSAEFTQDFLRLASSPTAAAPSCYRASSGGQGDRAHPHRPVSSSEEALRLRLVNEVVE